MKVFQEDVLRQSILIQWFLFLFKQKSSIIDMSFNLFVGQYNAHDGAYLQVVLFTSN